MDHGPSLCALHDQTDRGVGVRCRIHNRCVCRAPCSNMSSWWHLTSGGVDVDGGGDSFLFGLTGACRRHTGLDPTPPEIRRRPTAEIGLARIGSDNLHLITRPLASSPHHSSCPMRILFLRPPVVPATAMQRPRRLPRQRQRFPWIPSPDSLHAVSHPTRRTAVSFFGTVDRAIGPTLGCATTRAVPHSVPSTAPRMSLFVGTSSARCRRRTAVYCVPHTSQSLADRTRHRADPASHPQPDPKSLHCNGFLIAQRHHRPPVAGGRRSYKHELCGAAAAEARAQARH